MRKYLISILGIAALAVATFLLTGAFVSDATPKSASNRIVTGEYHQVSNGIKGTYMSAVVTNDRIVVTLKLDSGEEGDSDATGTFWDGTFDTSSTLDSFTVVSDPDLEHLNTSILGSSEDSKEFTYKNGDLSFQFSMLGLNTTVHLSK
jgi:hypothetical protein